MYMITLMKNRDLLRAEVCRVKAENGWRMHEAALLWGFLHVAVMDQNESRAI